MTSFIQDTLAKVPGVDPRVAQRSQFFAGMNDGPATTAARIAGLVQHADAKDDSPIYTGNFGQPIPDPGFVLAEPYLKIQLTDRLMIVTLSILAVSLFKSTPCCWRNSRRLTAARFKSALSTHADRLRKLWSPILTRQTNCLIIHPGSATFRLPRIYHISPRLHSCNQERRRQPIRASRQSHMV